MELDLVVRQRGKPERRLPVPAEGLTIGRVEGNDVVVPDVTMSRRHARLFWVDGVLHLQDVASTSGIYVDDRRWDPGPVPLGARIRMGQNEFQIVER